MHHYFLGADDHYISRRDSRVSVGDAMSKQELLMLLKLLSAIESAMSINKAQLPNYLFEQIDAAVAALEREILK